MEKLDGKICNGCRKFVYQLSDNGLCNDCYANLNGYVDNFEQIADMICDTNYTYQFYLLQIIHRDGNRNTVKRSFYINSPKRLDELKSEIQGLCNFYKARAYIQLNPINYSKIEWEIINGFMDAVRNNNLSERLTHIIPSVCSKHFQHEYWLVDIDMKDYSYIQLVKHIISTCRSKYINNDITIDEIPTVNGFHLIVRPFDLEQFYQKLELEHLDHIDIHKQCMTLLYYNGS